MAGIGTHTQSPRRGIKKERKEWKSNLLQLKFPANFFSQNDVTAAAACSLSCRCCVVVEGGLNESM